MEEVLLRGGFPELYAHREIEATAFYRSYIATYLERDLRQLHRGGIFSLAEAKWTEHPGQRDAEALLRIAGQLPSGRVRQCAIICRCANNFPVLPGVEAVSLNGLDALLRVTE